MSVNERLAFLFATDLMISLSEEESSMAAMVGYGRLMKER